MNDDTTILRSTAEVQELIRKTQSFQEAREQGQAVAAVEIATRLLRLGRPVAEVVEATELSIAKVGSLKKRLAENSLKPIHTRRTAKEHL